LGKPSSAAFSNSFRSKLALDSENTSPSRFASGPAFCALREMIRMGKERKKHGCDWLAKRGDVLEKHPKACLRVSFQNISGIRATNQPCVFRGNKLVPLHPC
jgi:hypothetical protein